MVGVLQLAFALKINTSKKLNVCKKNIYKNINFAVCTSVLMTWSRLAFYEMKQGTLVTSSLIWKKIG